MFAQVLFVIFLKRYQFNSFLFTANPEHRLVVFYSFHKTESGVELRILQYLFDSFEAKGGINHYM